MVFKLSYDELDGYIQQICTGLKLVHVEKKVGGKVPLFLRYPTKREELIAGLVHSKALEEAKAMELPTLEEMDRILRQRGIYTDADDEAIEKLLSRIKGQESILAKTTRVPANRNRLIDIIDNLKKEIETILLKREVHLENTQERKALEAKYYFLLQKNTFDPFSGELYWPTEEAFGNETDFILRRRALVQYVSFSHGMRQEVIRYIARSNSWRTRYLTATKTGDALFGIPISDYSVDQTLLLYWSHYYQSINEMLPTDRPADEIIEDDQALDAYMKDWQSDRNRDVFASKQKKGKRYGENSAWDYGETLVMKSNPMHKDIQYSETLAEKSKHAKDKRVDAAPLNKSKLKTKGFR